MRHLTPSTSPITLSISLNYQPELFSNFHHLYSRLSSLNMQCSKSPITKSMNQGFNVTPEQISQKGLSPFFFFSFFFSFFSFFQFLIAFIQYLQIIIDTFRYVSKMQTMDEFDIACNKENLQYYGFLREALQTRQLSYWIGNPSVQIINGVLYLDKPPTIEESCESTSDSFQKYLQLYTSKVKQENKQKQEKMVEEGNKILLLMGISNKKSPIEVLNRFVEYCDWIEEAKVIKTSHFCYYGILLLFKDAARADKFYFDELGQEYSSLEIQRVLIRRIQSATIFSTGLKETQVQKLLYLKGLPNQGEKMTPQMLFARTTILDQSNTITQAQSPKKKQIKENTQHTCPICFQETEGQYTVAILCEHFFHFKCLSQWNQNSCPMCRYHQQPPIISFCERCNQCQGLWICLTCGARLCCGSNRDILSEQSHIYCHYLETQHRLSIEAETKFIFDARQPAFLHNMFYREITQNEEIEPKKSKKGKLSEKISDYEQSISEEMQRQRQYFEECLAISRKKQIEFLKDQRKKLQDLQCQIKQIDNKFEEEEKHLKQADDAYIQLLKERKIIDDLQKLWKAKADANRKLINTKQASSNEELYKLTTLLNEKKQQLKDYRKNYQLSQKLKKNLQGQQVQSEMFLGVESKKRKK